MPAPRDDLERRLALATSGDTVRGLIFNAIFGVVRDLAGDDVARACDPAHKAARVDFLSYPVTDFLRIIWDAADRLEDQIGGADQAFFQVGRRAGALVLDSMFGKTLITLAVNGPRQLLASAPAAYRGTVSYGERRVEFVGPTHGRLHFKRDFLVPEFHCGVIEAGMERGGAHNVRVRGEQTGPLEATYDVVWDE